MLAMYTDLILRHIYLAAPMYWTYCSAPFASREVDISPDPCFTRTVEQANQGRALQRPGTAAHQYDQSGMRNDLGRLKEVIAVACHQDRSLHAGEAKNGFVRRIHRKGLSQPCNPVAEGLQREYHVVRDVVVKDEIHLASGTIWRATRTSISPRWSS